MGDNQCTSGEFWVSNIATLWNDIKASTLWEITHILYLLLYSVTYVFYVHNSKLYERSRKFVSAQIPTRTLRDVGTPYESSPDPSAKWSLESWRLSEWVIVNENDLSPWVIMNRDLGKDITLNRVRVKLWFILRNCH